MHQTYSQDFLQKIIDEYDVGAIRKCHLFTSGFENSNYYIETPSGKCVLKIFDGIGVAPETMKFEVEVMDRSFQAGVKTPQVYRNKQSELTTKKSGKLSVLMPFIEGENVEKQPVSDSLVQEVGEETGKMDMALSIFKDGARTRQGYEFDGKNLLLLEEKLRHLSVGFNREIFEGIFSRFREIKPILDTLPKGVIHNDVGLHNLLVKDGRLQAILDFSDFVFSPYIQNIAVSMAQLIFTYNWQPHQAKLFIDGYRKHHSLSTQELSLLYDLVLARYVPLVVEMHYWNVAYGEDAQRTEFVKDNYEFLKRLRSLGRAKFDTLI